MARILSINYFKDLFDEVNEKYETLSNWVLNKYGDDPELQTLLPSLGIKSKTSVPQVGSTNNVALGCESEINWTDENGDTVQIKPCSVELVKLAVENPEFSSQFEVTQDLEISHKEVKASENMKSRTPCKYIVCKFCSKEFKQKDNLKLHLRTQTGKRDYNCKVCQKKFTRKYHLTRHLLIHTGELPVECAVCKKKYKRKDLLQRHQRTHTEKSRFT